MTVESSGIVISIPSAPGWGYIEFFRAKQQKLRTFLGVELKKKKQYMEFFGGEV